MLDAMADGFGVGDCAEGRILRADGSYRDDGVQVDLSQLRRALLQTGGFFTVECLDAEGNRRWVDTAKNAVTNAALDDVLNVYLRGGTPTTSWYCGLVDNASFTQFLGADTMPSHSGWLENLQYTPANRIAWAPGAASSQSVTNSTPLSFAMIPSVGSPATIRGLFICSDVNSNSSGTKLFSTAAFTGGNQQVNNGDTLKVTYTVSASTS